MPFPKVVVYITIFIGLLVRVNGLMSMLHDVPGNLTMQTLNLCPCTLGESCNTSVTILMMESSASTEWFPINSGAFQSVATRVLQCEDQQLHLTISEGSFALLATGELLHVHSKLILSNSSFCFKRSFSGDFIIEDGQKMQQVMLEAEICMTPPEMSLCCPSGSVISKLPSSNTASDSSLSCEPSEAPSLGPPISFDGSSHKWPLEGQERGFPVCIPNPSTLPLNIHPGSGYLQLVEDQLQFRWQPNAAEKFIDVDSSQYCIGDERVYNSLRPVVAVCHSEHKPESYCSTTACFSKCCPEDQIYDLDLNKCVTSSFIYTWSPYHPADEDYRVVYGMPTCDSFFAISDLDPVDSFRLLGNGSLFIDSWSRPVPYTEYCFDIFRNQTHPMAMALVCFGDSWSKAHNNLEEQSTILYMLSSVLLISVVHLIVSLIVYLCTLRGRKCLSTKMIVCIKLNTFQSLMCVFVSFSAFQLLLVSLLQFMYQYMNQPLCYIIAAAAEWAALVSSGYVVTLWLQLSLRLHSPKMWETTLLFLAPVLLATLATVGTCFTAAAAPETCDINAPFADPWSAWPTTSCNAVLLLLGFSGLTLPLCWRKYTLTVKVTKQQSLCCVGPSVDEKDMENKSIGDECIEDSDGGSSGSRELRIENNRWWLLLKLACLLLATTLAPLLVWQPDASAFWAFGDIVLTFKGNVMASCLWIYLCKHCKRI